MAPGAFWTKGLHWSEELPGSASVVNRSVYFSELCSQLDFSTGENQRKKRHMPEREKAVVGGGNWITFVRINK